MLVYIKIIICVSLCTLFNIYANAIEYSLRRIHIPCGNRRNINPLLIKYLAMKKYYDDYMQTSNNIVHFNMPDSLANQNNNLNVKSQAEVEVKPAPKRIEEDSNKALYCAKLPCTAEELAGSAVCACNHITGRVATFKDTCDLKRHNCRYDTVFKAILPEICPWEYQFRRNGGKPIVDYSDPKYYNS